MTTIAERYAYFKRLIAGAILTPVIILLLLAGVLSWQIWHLVQAAKWVDHTDQVISQANLTLKIAVDAETGMRGYLVDGDPVNLQPYNDAQKTIGPAFVKLEELVSDNPPEEQLAH